MTLIGPHRKFVPEAHVYSYERYGTLEGSGHRDRHLFRKNRNTRRWKKRQAAYLRQFIKADVGIDPTKPVVWTRSFYTYTPNGDPYKAFGEQSEPDHR